MKPKIKWRYDNFDILVHVVFYNYSQNNYKNNFYGYHYAIEL